MGIDYLSEVCTCVKNMEPVQISSAASGSPPGRRVGGGATFRVSSAMRKELQDPLVCMTPRKPSCCCVLTLRTYQYDAASIYPQSFSPSVLLHTGVISQYFGGRYCFILRTSFLQYFGLGTASYCQYSQYFGRLYYFCAAMLSARVLAVRNTLLCPASSLGILGACR